MSEQAAAGENKQEKPVDLVFQGGGIKGIGLVGAYSVLEERGYQPVNMAGASAGAIVAALVAAGYSAEELYNVMKDLPLKKFKDKAWEDRFFQFVSVPLSIFKDKGIYEGNEFYDWIKKALHKKLQEKDLQGEELTFGDVRRNDVPEDAPPVYRYKLQVIVSDTTEKRMVVLPRDAHYLGIENPDDLSVARAVRMSMSIPVYFEPVRHQNLKTGREHLIVDGGMLSNFPIWLFDVEENLVEQEAKRPTFGLKLIEKDPRKPIVEPGFASDVPEVDVPEHPERIKTISYLWSLVSTMMEAHDRLYIEEKKFETTIGIDTLGVRTTEFTLSGERKDELYESGRKEAKKFLDKIESGTSPADTPPASSS
jgi:NTE family protein